MLQSICLMPVDPNNYQVSSRYKKSKIYTMKFLLLFMFVAVALATEEGDLNRRMMAEVFTQIFNITLAESLECVKKSEVTIEDMRYMEDSIDMNESAITDMKSLKRASCTVVCAAQKQGTMVGREIILDEVFKHLPEKGAPEHIRNLLHDVSRVCKDQVSAQNEPDECMVGYKFMKCMYVRSIILRQDT